MKKKNLSDGRDKHVQPTHFQISATLPLTRAFEFPMDEDDLTFGASVWESSEPALPPPSQPKFTSPPHDDFDDFGSPTETTRPVSLDDDDFGDFGEFGDAEENAAGPEFSGSETFGEIPVAGPSFQATWEPLHLDPMPDRVDLREQIDEILAPIWGDTDISKVTTNEGIREVEGITQILVNPERYLISCRYADTLIDIQNPTVENFTPCFSNPHHPPNHQTGRVLVYADST